MNSIKIFLVLVFLGIFCAANGQRHIYSYISDRKFISPEELIGYTFLPSEKEYTDGDKEEISPGGVIFAVQPQGVRISGGEYEGMYNAVSINSSKYGYIMQLMDARNPIEQGHIKFILDSKSNVDALIFKKNKNRPEVIYYLEQINDRTKKSEEKYFTDCGELNVGGADSIWGQKIRPFLRISQRAQDRIIPADSVYIEFVKEEIVKEVKEKPKEEVVEKPKEEVVEEVTLEGDDDFIMTDNEDEETDNSDEEGDDFDDDDEDWIDEDDPLAGMLKKQKKKKKEKKKEEVVEEEEEEVEDEFIDEAELARIEEEEALQKLEEEKNKKKVKTAKVKYKHYIVLRFNRWEGSGEEATIKEERLQYPVKTWKMRTSPDPRDNDVRHLLEYTAKPNSILVFTDDNNFISKIIIGNVEYLMRGY